MAKVTNPLYADFHEAFADVIVFQHNGSSSVIARRKVKHPENPRSAHYDNRVEGWAKAVDTFEKDEAPDEELLNYVSHYALSPDRPTNIECTALADNPVDPSQQQFTIQWEAPTTKYNGHPLDNLLGYFVEYTQDFVSWIRLNAEPITTEEFSASIPQGDTHIIVLAVDDENNVSSPSEDFFLELTIPQVAPPNAPTGIRKGFVFPCTEHPNCWLYRIVWDAPTHRTDGTPLDGLAGYLIESSFNNSDWTRIVTEPVTFTSYIGHCEATPQYRRVVALDLYGNESAPSNSVLIYRGLTPPL